MLVAGSEYDTGASGKNKKKKERERMKEKKEEFSFVQKEQANIFALQSRKSQETDQNVSCTSW